LLVPEPDGTTAPHEKEPTSAPR